jgi:hypothetical protein
MNNPHFEGCFCTNKKTEPAFHDNVHDTRNRGQINAIKDEFKPDLTIFRSWNSTSALARGDEVVWSSEKCVILHSGGTTKGYKGPYRNALNAFQDLDYVKEYESLWLPYCVSKYFEKKSDQKDYDLLCITTIPRVASGGASKKVSTDILLQPLGDRVVLYGKDRFNVPYLNFEESLHPMDIVGKTAKAKLFISPTTIWFDPYAISHKTLSTMGCGVLTMTNKYGAIEEILGKHKETILYSATPDETVELVDYYLSHEKEREEIANAGYEFAHSKYNWADHLVRLHDEVKTLHNADK